MRKKQVLKISFDGKEGVKHSEIESSTKMPADTTYS